MTCSPVMLMVRALDLGGCERDLAKVALGLDKTLFEPHVGCFFAGGFREQELRAGNVPVTCFPLRSYRSLSTLSCAWNLAGYLRRHKIKMIHAFDGPTALFAIPIAKAAGVPVTISSNLWFRDMISDVERHGLRVTDHMVDRIVVNSKAVAEHLVADDRVPRALTYLSYNGVDRTRFSPGTGQDYEAIRGAELVIGAVCALRSEKRIDLVIEAFARLHSHRPRLVLMIVGSGEMEKSLREQAENLGLGSSCVFVPAQKDVAPWMRAMNIFVLASSSESFPNSVLEAMACECCVVASNVGGVPEVVLDRNTGLLFQCGDVDDLTRVLSVAVADKDLRERLSKDGSRYVRENFSIEAAVERLQVLYSSLLS